jgi:hypothetical protein
MQGHLTGSSIHRQVALFVSWNPLGRVGAEIKGLLFSRVGGYWGCFKMDNSSA